MNKNIKIWLLVVVSGLLLIGASLVSGASDDDATACDSEDSQVAPLTEPLAAASIGIAGDLGIFQDGGENACLNCHSDQDRVKELAVEEETAESLSEGPG